MLADDPGASAGIGALQLEIAEPGVLLDRIVDFIARVLEGWRDDPDRPAVSGEVRLNSQLAKVLDDAARRHFDYIAFGHEEPDEARGGRTLDIAARPSNCTIIMCGQRYTRYRTLLPIECKRLPTPRSAKRDEREYAYSSKSTTGGIHRFKMGWHGANNSRGAMIGYIQAGDPLGWRAKINGWLVALSAGDPLWGESEELVPRPSLSAKVCRHRSIHPRFSDGIPVQPITLDHLWVCLDS